MSSLVVKKGDLPAAFTFSRAGALGLTIFKAFKNYGVQSIEYRCILFQQYLIIVTANSREDTIGEKS